MCSVDAQHEVLVASLMDHICDHPPRNQCKVTPGSLYLESTCPKLYNET